MKIRKSWAGVGALAASFIFTAEVEAAYTNSNGVVITNGTILLVTRSATDAFWRQQSSSSLWDGDDAKGPGIFTPGDAAMGILLQDYGYTVRMEPEKALSYGAYNWSSDNNPLNYYTGGGGPSSGTSNVLWSAMLVIVSGAGGSADIPPPNTNGIPIIMGEHSCLGNDILRDHAQLFLYSHRTSGNLTLSAGLYMKVMAPDHPIMQGIPLDSQGRVKIFREPYPEENLHNAPGGKQNYEVSWTAVDCSEGKSVPAPGLTKIGILDSNTNQVVFAVMDTGGTLADTTEAGDTGSPWYGYTKAPSRIVQLFINEGGSNNSRRAFNALTTWGRIIFIRACKWAMGEPLAPYKGYKVIDVGQVGTGKIKVTWEGTTDKLYRLDGSDDLVTWQPLVEGIPASASGQVSRTLDISAAPQALFMRVTGLP